MMRSSDAYVCSNCFNCHDVLFCFNQRNRRCCIGNLELPKERYLSLKSKLLDEITDEIMRTKRFPFVFELVPDEKPSGGLMLPAVTKEEAGDMRPIEKAFSSTFRLLFKKDASDLPKYGDWLKRHVPLSKEIVSPFGNKTYLIAKNARAYSSLPEKRIVSGEEITELGKLCLDEGDVSSLETLKGTMSRIGYFTYEIYEGQNLNVIKSPIAYNASNAFDTNRVSGGTEYAAFSAVTIKSKYAFGCNEIEASQFCIKCHNSLRLGRCFEVETSTNCSDSYFCHNCEGLQDAMFCFNTKSKRHAIGNSELSPDQFRKIRDMLVEQMADEILKDKELTYDIFNIGCGRI